MVRLAVALPGSRAEAREYARVYAPMAVLSGIWFLAKFARALFPPLFPELQATYGVGSTETGLLFSVLMGGYGLMQFPSGVLADRVGPARVITVGAVAAVVGTVMVVVAPSFAVLVLAAGAFGLGTGVHKTVSVKALSLVYPDDRGGAIGAFDTVGFVGGAVAPLVLVALGAVALGWRVAFALAAGLGVVFVVLNRTYVTSALDATDDPATDDAAPPETDVRAYLGLFGRPRIGAFVAAAVLYSTVWNAVVAFLPLYLIEVKGLSAGVASLLYSGLLMLGLVQMPAGGVADRVGEIPVLVGTYLLAFVGLVALEGAGGVVAVVLTGGLFGLAMHGARPVRGSYLLRVFPDSAGGGGLGLVRTLMVLVGAAATAVVGTVADSAGLATAFGGIAAVSGLSAALMVLVVVFDRRA
ncbi:MAG: MFS transporter [Haloferacaceae archaeon]